ncbi:calcitonin gene-related peptide-like isoform X2 [Myxocyprinus asiaticus]|uniref:calcitonin gene-related peptide-like isoform X2 n=1 Tax=Myxocyprinus asiaticus TaxID=70543 RepID=UPI002221F075|nr:calcitonin gene-related peptide-like isoform X2 [Myxocyprinus asiaticus]
MQTSDKLLWQIKSRRKKALHIWDGMKGTMFMLKISAFLVAYAVVVCQMCKSDAAPVRAGSESLTDRLALMDYETQRLLSAIVKNVVQMTAEELEPTNDENSITAQKRACNTATCVTHRLADFLSRSGGIANSNFIPTNVGAKAFGRRRRKPQIESEANTVSRSV